MSDFDVNSFISDVDVFPGKGSGEYERRGKALDSYLTYECYKDWEKAGKSIVSPTGDCTLGADILTSILTPVNMSLEATGNVGLSGKGAHIKRFLEDRRGEDDEAKKKLKELMPYYRVFSSVYYWIGNMLPVPRNFCAQSRDTWKFKLDCMQKWWNGERHVSGKENYENTYINWINYMKKQVSGGYAGFISACYLDDMVDEDCKTKPVFESEDYRDNDQLMKTDDTALIKEWFVKNAEILIQRSYRIWNGRDNRFKDWSGPHLENVNKIMDTIFKEIKDEWPISVF